MAFRSCSITIDGNSARIVGESRSVFILVLVCEVVEDSEDDADAEASIIVLLLKMIISIYYTTVY